MFNEEFLSSLTILYVEDEDLARERLGKTLKRFFKNVLLASNGEEGYITFKKEQLNGNVDLILSDINMPKMNGIEMLEKIREEGHAVPIIYTTARTESEYLLRAIELNVNHYVLKPINIENIISNIQDVCEKKYFNDLVRQKNGELEQYSAILDNVAVVFKMNNNKEIIFMNSLLLESFGLKSEDVLNKPMQNLLHKEIDSNFIEDIWEIVKKGKSWNGNIKFADSKNEEFYVNSTIFQIISDNGFEYVNIGFLSTQEVQEKREFHKKVIEQIKNTKLESSQVKNEVANQKQYIHKLTTALQELQSQLKSEKEKRQGKVSQLNFFEKELSNTNERIENILGVKNKEIENFKINIENLRKEITSLNVTCKDLEEQLVSAHDEIDKLENIIKLKKEKIITVSDLLEHRESQLKQINPDLIS
ncbi:response regulator [Arcobacter sp. LA11]|uniref:response regulator n=1 Tax=Arcobacter sp. LA11 TaxID=1898176 RepID=UPI0009339B69|nr:response regulator [Arcobacter sp. LA11]